MSNVFSNADLDTLAEGRCVDETNRRANKHIAYDLTERPDFLESMEDWYACAATHGDTVAEHYRHKLRSSVKSYKVFNETLGEIMAAYFLERQQGFIVRYVDVRPGKRTPDLEVSKGGLTLVVEVKSVVGGKPPGVARLRSAGPNVAPKLIESMNKARGQLVKAKQNLLVVVDWWHRPIFRKEVIDALYGTVGISMTWQAPDGPFRSDARLIRIHDGRYKPEFNTRFGAVGFLRWNGSALCNAYFIHNAYAEKPLPGLLFDPWPQFMPNEDRTKMIWRNDRE